jgi:anthraniloyl-CoA monooxygenase
VLLGDAAHTAHFTIGSGTKLAMEDSIALASALDLHGDDLEHALTDYELERQPAVERLQEAARESAAYFESVGRYATFEPLRFAFNLLTRSGRITHLELEKRDPAFVARVDARFAGNRAGALVAPPPLLAPLGLRGISLANRVAISVDVSGTDGPGRWEAVLESGAGLMIVDHVAVSAEGRPSAASPGLWSDDQVAGLMDTVSRISADGRRPERGVVLTHAGRRGSMRPPSDGVDRPLRDGGWETVAPSALPLTARHPVPKELDADGIARIADDFASAAGRAAASGSLSLVMVDMAHGRLLASFLSPMTNRRTDAWGGSLENRMRFPLEVFERVRAAWPPDLPAGVQLTCSDMARGGFDVDGAVVVAGALRDRGCDLIEVAAGQTIHGGQPDYRRLFLVPLADRIRNEAGVVTMVGGNITKPDDANTILAAGRADLVSIDPRLYAV